MMPAEDPELEGGILLLLACYCFALSSSSFFPLSYIHDHKEDEEGQGMNEIQIVTKSGLGGRCGAGW